MDAACCQGGLTLKRRGPSLNYHMEGIVAVGIWRVVEMWTLHCQGLRRYRLTLKRRGPSLTIIMEGTVAVGTWGVVEMWTLHEGIAKV